MNAFMYSLLSGYFKLVSVIHIFGWLVSEKAPFYKGAFSIYRGEVIVSSRMAASENIILAQSCSTILCFGEFFGYKC
ncbi:hypothetical protein F6U93_07565 [Tamlana haliotis]|uniref:Uncharacterized protein n=1 Tax=Pseudotamlana haliotis TaxID=2614804 RepID=A0A6N6MCA2_9FLAO|nr:hypothetical protein [Tamlana haliotis]KAB1068256.1 hypothetical protein F6U93_07565 [Tamlana haliotis]